MYNNFFECVKNHLHFLLEWLIINLCFFRIPVQLLEKKSVRSEDGKLKLMEIIKNPVLDHLPEGCHKISTSFSSAKWSRPIDLVPEDGKPVAIVVGAMTEGQVSCWIQTFVETQLQQYK